MTTVLHAQGFAGKRGIREVHVSQQEADSVITVAKGTIERATASDHTELLTFQRTWPIDGYGQDWAVVEVNATTRTTLDGGKTWTEMWHWFGTASSPWPLIDAGSAT